MEIDRVSRSRFQSAQSITAKSVIAVVFILMTTACSISPDEDSRPAPSSAIPTNDEAKSSQPYRGKVAFLRTSPQQLGPSAMQSLTGRLEISQDGCVLIEVGSDRLLIFWPPETQYRDLNDRPVFTDSAGREIMEGSRISIGGTGSNPPSVTSLGGVEIPRRCRSYNAFIVNKSGVTTEPN